MFNQAVVLPWHAQLYEMSLREEFPESLNQVIPINSKDDLLSNLLPAIHAGRLAVEKNTVTCFMIKPDANLFRASLTVLDPEATRYMFIPGGFDELAAHEREHIEAAQRIREGRGLVSQFGVHLDFFYCLRSIVFPHRVVMDGKSLVVPESQFSTMLMYAPSVSEEERLAATMEIIAASHHSAYGLSSTDAQQLALIASRKTESTPLLAAVMAKLPPELFEKYQSHL
jgi:hypothetical protein